MMFLRHLYFVFVFLCFSAQAFAASEQETKALVRDVTIVVRLHEQTSWYADALEIDEIIEDVLRSTCLARDEVRTQALLWLDEEIGRLGGGAKEQWLEKNKDLGEVKDVLRLERVRMSLKRANDIAEEKGCPFWVEPRRRFLGEQSYAERLILGFEAGGRFMLGWQNKSFGFGGGGASRVLFGYGTAKKFSFLGGFEFGGGGRFSDFQFGQRLEMPTALFIVALPMVFRWHHVVSFNEIELSPAMYLNQLDDVFQPGIQSAIGLGFPRTRLADILPHVTFWLSYSYFTGQEGAPAVHQVCGGLRAGGSYLIGLEDD
ncbi:MAG: hypothetical protein QGI45_07905 [Myxococcota bacterium]|jgi:hypothetical protein|nr:hypothetical protein [Myxococcota bacterium]